MASLIATLAALLRHLLVCSVKLLALVSLAAAQTITVITPGGLFEPNQAVYFVAPDEIITVWGTDLHAGAPEGAASLPLPVDLGGTSLTITGTPARLLYVSDNQIEQ